MLDLRYEGSLTALDEPCKDMVRLGVIVSRGRNLLYMPGLKRVVGKMNGKKGICFQGYGIRCQGVKVKMRDEH